MFISLATLSLGAAFPTFAQNDSTKVASKAEDVFELSIEDLLNLSVELTTGSFLELDLKSSPISLTLINKDQIELSGARHLSELLEIYVPGFQYMYNKWNGVIWGMRGVAADRNTKVVFLINGHQMNHESRDGAMSELDLGLLGDIQQIEVLRGPAGLAYGSGAIAGVVNIVTKTYDKDMLEVRTSTQAWQKGRLGGSVEVMGNKKVNENLNVAVTGGVRMSEGPAQNENRIFGRGSWPYPGWLSSGPSNGAPTAGSSWSTPGNFRIGTDIKYKNLRFFSRFTNQVTNASGMFILDAWPEIAGSPSGAVNAEPKMIDGKLTSPTDPFYGSVEPWNTHRRQYLVRNWTNQLSWKKDIGRNTLKLDAGFDLVTNRIQSQKLGSLGFHNTYGANDYKSTIAETFGERRLSLKGVYNINTIDKLRLAVGYQFRMFIFGKDMNGFNMKDENMKHIIVSNTTYINNAVFAEGMYDLSKVFKLGFGARYDAHTRTINQGGVFTPKVALIVKANEKNTIKLIYQTSANNGSADNYEFNRNSVNSKGEPLSGTDYRYEKPSERPGAGSNVLAPVSQTDLHKLKPERSTSYEVIHVQEHSDKLANIRSLSLNSVRNLFIWNQDQFRVLNGGRYNFLSYEEEWKYAGKKLSFGFSHSIQMVVNTDVNQKVSYATPVFEQYNASNPSAIFYDSVSNGNGGYTFTPRVVQNQSGGDSATVKELYTIRDAISNDGQNFLNLASNVTKIQVNYNPIKKLSLFGDLRIFWGMQGRRFIQNASPGFNYLGANSGPMFKLHLAVAYKPTERLTVTLHGYDLLASNSGFGRINSLRWQQMGTPDQSDYFMLDKRSVAINILYSF